MQERLARSRTDVMIAGICGGLGEYFGIDPIFARLVFVLLTVTSGIGIPVYILLWVIMPKKGLSVAYPYTQNPPTAEPTGQPDAGQAPPQNPAAEQAAPPPHTPHATPYQTQHPKVAGPTSFHKVPPPPDAYKFDPQTGQPVQTGTEPHMGPTVRLELPPQATPPHAQHQTQSTPQQSTNWRKLGILLTGVGGLALLNVFGLGIEYIIPSLMIVAGIVLIRKNR